MSSCHFSNRDVFNYYIVEPPSKVRNKGWLSGLSMSSSMTLPLHKILEDPKLQAAACSRIDFNVKQKVDADAGGR